MKVLFDAFELSPNGGKSIGIYNYAVHLWLHLQRWLPEGMELVLACHADNAKDFLVERPDRVTKVQLTRAAPGRLLRQCWMRFGAQFYAKLWGCGTYFSPKGFLPGSFGKALGMTTCVVVHDLIPLWYEQHFPDYFGAVETRVVNSGLMRSCRHADQLIAISNAVADDIGRRVKGAKRPAVVYNGLCLTQGTPLPRPERRHIFAMSSALPHKNAAAVLAGYARYRAMTAQPLDLIICGIEDPGQAGVTAVKGLSSETLSQYYREAALFVFLSLTEGFGFPPLEAMASGTPVLCSDIEVLRETTQGNAFFVDPSDVDAVAHALEAVLSPEGVAEWQAQVDRSGAVVDQYSWDRCAKEVCGLLAAVSQ